MFEQSRLARTWLGHDAQSYRPRVKETYGSVRAFGGERELIDDHQRS